MLKQTLPFARVFLTCLVNGGQTQLADYLVLAHLHFLPLTHPTTCNMGSGMRSGFDQVQKLPGRLAHTLDQDFHGVGHFGADPSHPLLPPILPQVQTNLHANPFQQSPQEVLPSLSGLEITTSLPIRSKGPQRTASSPNYTQRFSPYERPSSQKSSPTQRAKYPVLNCSPSPEELFQSPMRRRQEGLEPSVYSLLPQF